MSNIPEMLLEEGFAQVGEWNVGISDAKDVFDEAQAEFLKLYYVEQTVPLTLVVYRGRYDEYRQKNPNLDKRGVNWKNWS